MKKENSPAMRFILASASPRRRELLERAGFSPEIIPANVEEDENPHGNPEEMVRHNARIKAQALAERFPDALILAADTTVALEGEVLNKPASMEEARGMLEKLSGRTHTVYTGVVLRCVSAGLFEEHCLKSRVVFKTLGADVISRYFQIVNPLDKAGAYGIQDGRELIVDSFEGPISNIMGLPVEFVVEELERLGLDKLVRS